MNFGGRGTVAQGTVRKGAAQGAERESLQTDATVCDEKDYCDGQNNRPKSLTLADLCDDVRTDATESESRPGGIRTPDQGIMSPLL